MTFSQSIRICMGPKYLFKFEGRASRSEYWWFTLFTMLTSLVLALLLPFFPPLVSNVIFLCAGLALLPASLGVTVRRMHDLNLSAWFLLLMVMGEIVATLLFAAFGLIVNIAFIVLFCLPGNPETNRFGPPVTY